jgi:hypothetical protein
VKLTGAADAFFDSPFFFFTGISFFDFSETVRCTQTVPVDIQMVRWIFSSNFWRWCGIQRSSLWQLKHPFSFSPFLSSSRSFSSCLNTKFFMKSSTLLSCLLCVNYLHSAEVNCDSTHSLSSSSSSTAPHSNLHLIEVETPLHETHWDYFMKGVETSFPDRPIYILFLADIPPNQSKRWCKDCVVAEPILFSELEEVVPNAVVVTCSVSRAPYKSPGYPYATNPSIKLACVPTLMRSFSRVLPPLAFILICFLRWKGNSGIPDRLNDFQCQRKNIVRNFLIGKS